MSPLTRSRPRRRTTSGSPSDDLEGPSRSKTLVGARQVAMYLCRELTDLSLPAIGAGFGNQDHTTVMHADRKIRKNIGEPAAVRTGLRSTNKIRVCVTISLLSVRSLLPSSHWYPHCVGSLWITIPLYMRLAVRLMVAAVWDGRAV